MSTLRRLCLIPVPCCLLLLVAPVCAEASGCVSSPSTLCVGDDRYQVEADWMSAADSGPAQVFPFATSSTGFFTLDDPGTVDLMVSVVNGCMLNDHSWVFMVDLSTLALSLTATDTLGGAVREYGLPLDSIHQPIADTSAFTCPEPSPPPPRDAGAATSGSSFASLVGGRFRVTVAWEDSIGGNGAGTSLPLTDSSAAFWYFNPDSPDRLLKIEPVVETGFYRLVSGSPSSVGHSITVLDTCTGSVWVHDQEPGLVQTIEDPQMHAIACANHIFTDGFESGNLSSWSASSP